jgi:hypothetical protein
MTPTPSGGPAALERFVRHVAAQERALGAVPVGERIPRDVLALLSTAPPRVDPALLPPSALPTLVDLHRRVGALAEDMQYRQALVAGRLGAIRAARRAGPAATLVDSQA